MTMVVVTHEMGFARTAANRVLFMADGAIVEEDTPEEFFTHPQSDRAKDFLGKILAALTRPHLERACRTTNATAAVRTTNTALQLSPRHAPTPDTPGVLEIKGSAR